jgi:hypothetical protein
MAFAEKLGGWHKLDRLVVVSWALLVSSVLFGGGVYQTIITNLEIFGEPRVYAANVRNEAIAEIALFLLGALAFLLWSGLRFRQVGGRKTEGFSASVDAAGKVSIEVSAGLVPGQYQFKQPTREIHVEIK